MAKISEAINLLLTKQRVTKTAMRMNCSYDKHKGSCLWLIIRTYKKLRWNYQREGMNGPANNKNIEGSEENGRGGKKTREIWP